MLQAGYIGSIFVSKILFMNTAETTSESMLPGYYTVAQVAKVLNLSKQTIYYHSMQPGILQPVKIFGRSFYPVDQIN